MILKELRKKRGESQEDVAKALNTTLRTYQNYEYGQREPNIEMILKIADYFNVSIDYLLGREPEKNPIAMLNLATGEKEVMEKYIQLPDDVRKIILNTMIQLAEAAKQGGDKEQEEQIRDNIVLTMYEDAVSAGTGEFLNNGRCIDVTVERTYSTEQADCIIRVSGDSMEPTYYDGDKVLVKYTQELEFGDIGIFVLNNEGYIKEYGQQGLISHNKKYDVIVVHEYDECKPVGKVIGKL